MHGVESSVAWLHMVLLKGGIYLKVSTGGSLFFLSHMFITVCHNLSTPPALQRCAGENSILYMCPPVPEAKSSEVEAKEMHNLSGIGGKPW